MRRKQAYLLWTAAGAVLGIGAVNSAHATPTVNFNIAASGGNWTAYVDIDSATDNAGLATFAIDITGSGGVSGITSKLFISPESKSSSTGVGLPLDQFSGEGFVEFTSNGAGGSVTKPNGQTAGNGVGLSGGQNVDYDTTATYNSSDNGGIVEGYGQPGKTSYTNGASGDTFTWSNTGTLGTEIAFGTYSGTAGSISVNPDFNVGQGVQTLNYSATTPAPTVGGPHYAGPGNLTLLGSSSVGTNLFGDTVSVGGSTPSPTLFSLTATSLVGTDDLAGATVTPAADDVNDVITESGGHGSDSYDAIHIHEAGNGVSNGGFQFAGFHQGDNIDVLLKFSNLTTGTDPVTGNAQLLSDIENYINANDGTSSGITVSTVPAALASDFPGTSYDLLLSLPSPTTDPFADFNFSGFTGDGLSAGQLGLSDIGVVPEPASLGLLMLGGIGLVGRRRKKDSK